MLLILVLSLHLPHLGALGQDCPENCVCENSTCVSCIDHFTGDNCTDCPHHCKAWRCWPLCPLGCDKGWYKLGCDQRCPEECLGEHCEQFHGTCYKWYNYPSHCWERKCKVDCEYYCKDGVVPSETEHGKKRGQFEWPLEAEQTLMMIVVFVMFLSCCTCGIARAQRKRITMPDSLREVIPFRQRLLTGSNPDPLASSTSTHDHTAYSNAVLDSRNVLRCPWMYTPDQPGVETQIPPQPTPPPPYSQTAAFTEPPPPYETVCEKHTE